MQQQMKASEEKDKAMEELIVAEGSVDAETRLVFVRTCLIQN